MKFSTRELILLLLIVSVSSTLWPLPQIIQTNATQYSLILPEFSFNATGNTSDILASGFSRYITILKEGLDISGPFEYPHTSIPQIVTLQVDVLTSDTSLTENTIENYTLEISAPISKLQATTVYGALRGLETFSQMTEQSTSQKGLYILNQARVIDWPRFQYRGSLIDTARHFLDVNLIYEHLDAMAYNKLNILHWHVTDDQSFPFVSKVYPLLSQKGSFTGTASHLYSPDQVQAIINYARFRGIRVIPEFDSPGHTFSWGRGYPFLLSTCYSFRSVGQYSGQANGPLDPTLNSTYEFVSNLFKEISTVFPDAYMHIGGDEVDQSCWESNPDILKWMKEHNISDYSALEQYYVTKVINIVEGLNKKSMVWQDVIDNGVEVFNETVVEVWENPWQGEMKKITGMGLKTVLSSPWYLNYISYGSDWINYYGAEPTNFGGSQQQIDLVKGGEVCLWGEYIDDTNFIPTLWPRASAVAERLWSNQSVTDVADATSRINDQTCRMVLRNINAQPINGPSYCLKEWVPSYQPPE